MENAVYCHSSAETSERYVYRFSQVMEVDSTICAGLGGHVLTSLHQTSKSQANALNWDLPQITGLIIFHLLKIRLHIKHCLGGYTVCNMVLDVLESIVPSRHSVSGIA